MLISLRNLQFAVTLVFIATVTTAQNQNDYLSLSNTLEKSILQKMKENNIVGASIALIEEDQVVWAKGFGYTDNKKTQPVSEETVFSVQSVSKPVTTTVFMMQVQKKTISLDDKLKKYYPEFTINSRLGSSEADKITFRQLLSHRAGFAHEPPKGNNYSSIAYPFDEHVKSISNMWLKLPVGKFYSYSNPGIDLVGYVLSKNVGKSFDVLMKDEILTPLGMRSSTFNQTEAQAMTNRAKGYVGDFELPYRAVSMLAAGGLFSNAIDLSKFVMFHLNGCKVQDQKLISEALQEQMYQVQYPVEHQKAGYALGIRTKPYRGGRFIHHRGGGYGFSTIVGWIPEYKLGIVILTNDGYGSSFIGDIVEQSLSGMISIKKGSLPAQAPLSLTNRPVIHLKEAELTPLIGSYKSSKGILELTVEKGELYTVGTTKALLNAHSNTEFSSPNGELFIFHRINNSTVDYVLNINDSNAEVYMFNDTPNERAGPSKASWNSLIGTYVGANNDVEVINRIFLKNGYLYSSMEGELSSTYGAAKITEYKPGFFFSSDGEALQFNGDSLLVGNRPFIKKK